MKDELKMSAKKQEEKHVEPPQAAPPANLPAATASYAGQQIAVYDYGRDAGAGMQNVTADEVRIPLFRVLQSNSPQCKPVSAGGVDGARASMLFNTSSLDFYDGEKGLGLIPCYRDHNYVEYIPRDAGGGFVGIHSANEDIVDLLHAAYGRFGKLPIKTPAAYAADLKSMAQKKDFKEIKLHGRKISIDEAVAHFSELGFQGGTELTETFYLFSLLLPNEDMVIKGVVPFQSTQIGKYQSFMDKHLSIKYPTGKPGEKVNPPIWAHRYQLTTLYQKHKRGEFFGLQLRFAVENDNIKSRLPMSDPLYKEAREFYNLVAGGGAKADIETDTKSGGADTDEEIPF